MIGAPPESPSFPYPPLFRSRERPPQPRRVTSPPRGCLQRVGPHVLRSAPPPHPRRGSTSRWRCWLRSEEHTSELQSQSNLVCRLLLEKKKTTASTPLLLTHA